MRAQGQATGGWHARLGAFCGGTGWRGALAGLAVLWLGLVAGPATAQDANARNRAPGFTGLQREVQLLVAPIDVELFVISAGGLVEPKADWTESAQQHMKTALDRLAKDWGVKLSALPADKADDLAEVLSLQGAVARAVAMHHQGPLRLPTKGEKLDWSFGDTLRPLQQASGARYALFTWVRDSYASAERKAMMVGMALLGIGLGGGLQQGYATLVDLEDGRVLWFNSMFRGSGDLREAAPAEESMQVLLKGFPAQAPAKP